MKITLSSPDSGGTFSTVSWEKLREHVKYLISLKTNEEIEELFITEKEVIVKIKQIS